MNNELESLNNLVKSIGLDNLAVYEKPFHDKRRSIKKYFVNIGNATISPTLEYENINLFLLGFYNAKTHLQKAIK